MAANHSAVAMAALTSPTAIDLIESAAESFPQRMAVVSADEVLTYAQLIAQSRRVAAALAPYSLPLCRPVAVLMSRSARQIAVLTGIMLAGLPYLCLDERAPTARWAELLRQSDAALVMADADLAGQIRDVPVLSTGVALTAEGRLSTGRPGPLDLAYLIYTSGSTGGPKGVPIRQESLAAYCQAITGLLGSNAGLGYASVSSLSTDLGNTAVFGALASGGCLHLIDEATYRDPFAFADYLRGHHVEVLKITPSHLSALLEAEDPGVLPAEVLVLGGEKLPWSLTDEVFRVGACRVINHYGPTEATIGCLAYEVKPDDPLHRRTATVPIGRPLAGARIRVVDHVGKPVGPWESGTLLIAGTGVCHGYWHRPDLTAQRFSSDECGMRWYRAGDRVRLLPDGVIEYLEREDDQIKIRGYRVEPAEPQAVLAGHPGVRQAVVLPAAAGAPRLLAFAVPQPGHTLSDSDLQTYLRAALPEYLVPATVTVMDRLPLSSSGKVDRQLLLERGPVDSRPAQPDHHSTAREAT